MRQPSTGPTTRLAVGALAAALVAGCSGPASDPGALTVFAAASLKPVFTELADEFEKLNPGTGVVLSFAGSSDLASQLTQGAPADVFASADERNMARMVEAGLVAGDPVDFAANRLTIVTPPANPKGIASFADLAAPGTAVVICAPQVPCGAATQRVEKATGVTLRPVSEESAVTDVLGKVLSGQADAGVVYVTDAKNAGDKVAEVPFAESVTAVNTYPIAVLSGSADPVAARRFVDFVTGDRGRTALVEAGFATP